MPHNGTATIWPVWSGSAIVAERPRQLSKKNAQKLWWRARAWDQRTRQTRKHGGAIGRSGLLVLYSLLHDFLNYKTGRLDPAVNTIAKRAGLCARTVHTALNRLRAAGLLRWQRRCENATDEQGRFILRQLSNLYEVTEPANLAELAGEMTAKLAEIEIGRPAQVDTFLEEAAKAGEAGETAAAVKLLDMATDDPLAQALAGLYRAMQSQ